MKDFLKKSLSSGRDTMMALNELSRYNHLATLNHQYDKREWFLTRLLANDDSKHEPLIRKLMCEMISINWIKKQRELPSFSMTRDYWQEDAWQQAVADSVQAYRKEHGEAQKLLFSFHGIPESYQERGDLYGPRCLRSAEQIASKLGLKADQWQACFQSRFGPQPWLQPYTDKTLEAWGAQGVESVQVVCPGFSADCLETLGRFILNWY